MNNEWSSMYAESVELCLCCPNDWWAIMCLPFKVRNLSCTITSVSFMCTHGLFLLYCWGNERLVKSLSIAFKEVQSIFDIHEILTLFRVQETINFTLMQSLLLSFHVSAQKVRIMGVNYVIFWRQCIDWLMLMNGVSIHDSNSACYI